MPQPRVHPSPVRVPFATGGVGLKGVTPDGVLGGKNPTGRAEMLLLAQHFTLYAGQMCNADVQRAMANPFRVPVRSRTVSYPMGVSCSYGTPLTPSDDPT